METKTRVLVADPSEDFRRSLSEAIEAESGLEAVGFAEDGIEALALTAELKPDILLTELVLPKLDGLVNWANAVEEYALDQALQGVKFPGFKVVEGRSIRKYADDKKVAERLEANGYGDIIYKPKELKTITTLEKALTKKGFEALVGDLIVKPAGKPTLVPESDKRPEWSSAEEDFKDVSV